MKKIKLNKYFLPHNAGGYLWLLIFMCLFVTSAKSQDANASGSSIEALKPVKNTFDDIMLIDDQTVMVPQKKTFEFAIEHRFGAPITDGYKDMCGLFTGANMALKFYYSPIKNLNLGIGINEENKTWEGNLKYALMRQSEKGGWPVSISYYGNFGVDGRKYDGNFVSENDRLSYFHQIMIARKITDKFSAQAGASLSYFNNVPGYVASDGTIQPTMNNNHYAMEFLGRYKVTDKMAVIVDYDQPLTTHPMNNPHPNVAFGIDLGTTGHSFQIFLTNFGYTLQQNDNFLNQNDFTKGQWVIGFNITRKWHF